MQNVVNFDDINVKEAQIDLFILNWNSNSMRTEKKAASKASRRKIMDTERIAQPHRCSIRFNFNDKQTNSIEYR